MVNTPEDFKSLQIIEVKCHGETRDASINVKVAAFLGDI
jgi:hypothetical protein